MSRDDFDDGPRRRARKKDNTLLVVLLAVGGAVVLGCVGVGALAFLGWRAPAAMTRDEFREAVVGKTPDEVLAAVGVPDSTQELDATGARYWYYRGRTRDPVTGKVDGRAQVVFGRSGVVERVNY